MQTRSFSSILAALIITLLATPAPLFADDEEGFKPIFDGQSLDGWRPHGDDASFWRVEDGAIVGESTEDHQLGHNTFLVWDYGQVDDFELRLQFRISGSNEANSGIQFRGVQRDDGHVIGYQADIDRAGNWVGCLYDEAQRGALATRGQQVTVNENAEIAAEQVGDSAELFSHVNINDWNEYTISARGNVITLALNGHQTVQVTDNDPNGLDLSGLLALQLHSGPPMKIEFRNIRLKRFPLEDGRAKIVLIAGSASHGYYEHEHNAGCLLLAAHLNEAAREHGLPVTTAVYNNGWPKDVTALDNADCVVAYCDGGGGHYLNDRLEDFDWYVENQHVGLVCIHYGVEVPAGPSGEHFLKWIGGYFEPHWSVNPHWDASFDELPEHPITNGVEPFTINDEWYYHMRFPEDMAGVTPILTDLPPRETLNREDGPHSGNPHVREAVLQRMEPQHVGWAFERPDGTGRGFGFTGGHFHRNWQDDNFRKLVLNAICWAAQLDVPEDGVTTHTPTQEEMDANQDEQPPGNAAIQQPAETVPVAFDDEGDARPVFSSDLVTTSTPEHSIVVEADITGADKLFLVVTDGGNGFACDWADWADPVLIEEVAERRVRVVNGREEEYEAVNEVMIPLTTLDWVAASSEWGQVRKNANAEGGTLRIDGLEVEDGIGTHANSIIEFDLPEGHAFTGFRALAGLDNGGTNQGSASSVQFHVFTERPSRRWLAHFTSGGGGNAPDSHESVDAIDQIEVHPDLEATLFAAEPMMLNPTDIDIDHLGRVWVCEVVNYRRFANSDHPERLEGDRILIIEDTNHDGVADESTVFYQGRDVDSAHGICVLPTIDGKGTRAIISCGDSVFFLIDDDGDLQADRKELLFTGIDGTQHDHGIHAFVFGPDGKLYFNFGNAGRHISDKDGNPIVDRAGNAVNDSRQPYQEGMVFRCNMDGSEFETLAWNFRNNWEVAVDSFGTMWQSDNDDDGNRGVRINYVMEFGNFGYRDELTGAGWQEPRTGWNEEIPERHWHLNDPGVVPNLLQTGAGSPTGICVYEGSLLPTVFQGQVIHTDAGPNICRAYPVEVDGAGYTAEIVNILDGAENQWFRPSDVCVAPDGSLIVADWYDPGVGGHRMQDVIHGRLFRVTPAGSNEPLVYRSPVLDVSTAAGAVEALKSPNMSVRYLAWNALYDMGADAVPALEAMFHGDENPRFRARALWLLGKLTHQDADTLGEVIEGLQDENADIRVTAVRLARQLIHEGAATFQQLEGHVRLDDPSPAVRRELAIGIRDLRGEVSAEECTEAWVALARQHDGEDRWYLEALGIAADGYWDEYLPSYLEFKGAGLWPGNNAACDIVWRSRSAETPRLLATVVVNGQRPADELPRYFRAFDFLPQSETKRLSLSFLASAEVTRNEEQATFIKAECLSRLQGVNLASNAELAEALSTVLDASRGTPQFVDLVNRFEVADRYPELLALAQEQPDQQLGVDALRVLLDRGQLELIAGALAGDDPEIVERTFTAIGTAGDGRTVELLQGILADESKDVANRRAAIRALGSARQGAEGLLGLAQSESYEPALKDALAATLTSVEWDDIKGPALAMFPLPETQSMEPIPPIAQLIERSGDVANGRLLFHSTATCHKCHQVNGIGQIIGPDLSEIGRKLTRQAMYESVLFPSAGISHNFETWAVATIEGDIVTGLLMSETADAIDIKTDKGLTTTIAVSDIEERRKLDVSLMPADLMKLMSVSDLVDIVEYMTTLQQKQEPVGTQ